MHALRYQTTSVGSGLEQHLSNWRSATACYWTLVTITMAPSVLLASLGVRALLFCTTRRAGEDCVVLSWFSASTVFKRARTTPGSS